MKKNLLLMAIAAMVLPLSGQSTIDVLQLSGRYGFPGEYKDPDRGGDAAEWGMINSLTIGKKLGKGSTIALNVNHFYFNVQGQPGTDFPSTIASPVSVNGIILRTGVIQDLGRGRSLQVLVAPRIMSDFINVDKNSYMLGGVLAYKKKYRDDLSIGFGGLYNTELFGPYFVPFVDLYWKPASKWTIRGMIPISARIEYGINENMTAGFNHFGLITTYALGHDDYRGDYLERQSIDLSLFLRQRLAGPLYIEGMAGYAVGRKYVQYEGDQKVSLGIPLVTFGDERVVKNRIDTGFDNGVILHLKLILNMPVPE